MKTLLHDVILLWFKLKSILQLERFLFLFFMNESAMAKEASLKLQLFVLAGGGRRRTKQSNGENGMPAPLGRTNTMYQQPSGTGYGGFAYTTSGNRAQFFLNQIPYVAAQSSQTAEYVEWLTR